MRKNSETTTVRNDILLEQLVLVDGQPGCGKTLFTAIVAAMERVELLNYSCELENLCALNYLNKISEDAVESMIRIQMDLVIYETMMSRRTNFRPRDLSSVFRYVDWFTYLKRLLQKGDEVIPERIRNENPILHFATHNLLAFSEPIFKCLEDKVTLIEIVRHPLYILIQQTLNQINQLEQLGTARQFHLFIKHADLQVPFWNYGQEELYINSNPVERAIYEMQKLTELTEDIKKIKSETNEMKVLTIPFESFVLDPWPYLHKIEELLGSKITSKTKKVIKKQNVPRKKISDGIPLAIYKRCGWEAPDKNLSEKEELEKRRQFAVEQGASDQALKVLDKLCVGYESNYYKVSERSL
jgi:hypothetical protein